MTAYELTSAPALVDLGKAGRATVRASVPFMVGAVQHCADYLHVVDAGRRKCAVFQPLAGHEGGILKVWPAA